MKVTGRLLIPGMLSCHCVHQWQQQHLLGLALSGSVYGLLRGAAAARSQSQPCSHRSGSRNDARAVRGG
jgi:hypothetical protein